MKNYISNKEFLIELKKYHQDNIISQRLHEMFYILSQRISRKRCWYYKIMDLTIRESEIQDTKNELIHEGYHKCLQRVNSFDIEKENPFAYFTSIIHNCFKDFFSHSIKQDILKLKSKNDYNHKFLMRYGFKPTEYKGEKE